MTAQTFGPIITAGPTSKEMKFGADLGVYQHSLHNNPMFDDAGLAALLDAYPRERLGIYTMGHDPKDYRSWRRGSVGDLLETAKNGRLWLNMRWTNKYIPGYQQLVDQMFGELHRMHPGMTTFKHDFGVLISSPNAQVFYHLDIPLVALWQVRGTKILRAWQPREPFISDADLERSAMQDSNEIFDYNPIWDQDAAEIVLSPGVMATWPQNGPHRLVNGDMLNVSLSIEFMTPAAMLRANVIYGNGVMRRRFNMPQRLRNGLTPQNIAKVGLARVAKKLNWYPPVLKSQPITFQVEPAAPNAVRDIAA
jgi:hypothetical protein